MNLTLLMRTRHWGLIIITSISCAVFIPLLFAPLTLRAQSALTRELSVGMKGSDVTLLQTYLARDSTIYPEGSVTGYYGPLTQAAVSRFQSGSGLFPSGSVDAATRDLINQRLGASGMMIGPDESAPILGPGSVKTTANSATFTWTTNEPSTSRVMYATTKPFLYATASYVTGVSGMSHAVVVSGLSPGQTYYYTIESIDPSGNMSVTLQLPFMTKVI